MCLFVWRSMALIHLCQGGVFSLFPSLTSELFGRKNVGPVFSLLFGARLAAVALASLWTNVRTAQLTGCPSPPSSL